MNFGFGGEGEGIYRMEEGGGGKGFPSYFSPLFFSFSQIEDTGDEEAAVHLVPPPSTYSCIIPKYCFLLPLLFAGLAIYILCGKVTDVFADSFFSLSCASRPCSIPQRAHNWQSENGAQKDGEGVGQCFGFSGRGNEVGVLEGRRGGVQKGGQFLIRRVRPPPSFF